MKWICFSGIDGSGKSSLMKYSYNLLNDRHKVCTFKSPPTKWIKDMLQASGNGNPYGDPYTDNLIFSAALRSEMYHINNLSRKYQILISKRSWIDQFPYRKVQGISYNQTIKLLRPLKFLVPDIVFYIDCNPKTAYGRIKKIGDKFETLQFITSSRKEHNLFYDKISKMKLLRNIKVIKLNGNKKRIELKKKVKEHLKKESLL